MLRPVFHEQNFSIIKSSGLNISKKLEIKACLPQRFTIKFTIEAASRFENSSQDCKLVSNIAKS